MYTANTIDDEPIAFKIVYLYMTIYVVAVHF
jgi:hypothetical protein